jgi:hypothetical protein
MDREKQNRINFISYEETKFAQDTRWDEMLKQVG